MSYQVTVTDAGARPTAVVAAATTWPEFPALCQPLLDEVWAWAGQMLMTTLPRTRPSARWRSAAAAWLSG